MQRCLGCMEMYGDEYDICPYCGYVKGTGAEEAIHMAPGSMLSNRYIVGKVLGFGGFGVTYVGYDGKLGQKVAIKEYLPSEFSTRMPGSNTVTIFEGDKNTQFKDGMVKFVDEAKRLAKFQDEDGIVQVMDCFIENETAYIIMELLEGETLADKIKREGTIPEYEAIELLKPVMMSLSVVHQEGILHRDISPDNIFITNDGQVKLIDFGASRFATTSHSRSLTVIIKPGYSPEEQYRSRGDQGPWTDVYALGACLYKMITGKTPPDAMERRAKFETKNKDILTLPSKLVKKISVIHENAILNAMNVRIEDRTPDVQTFLDELTSNTIVKRKNGRIKKIDVYRWPLWFKISVAALVLAIVSTGTLMALGVIKVDSLFSETVVIPDGMVTIPDITNTSITKATKNAESAKLNVAIAGSIVSPYVEAGKIVYQEPRSGMVCSTYSVLSLFISKGNGEIIKPVDGMATVPYLVGSTLEETKNDLKVAGLAEPKLVYEYDENIAEGLIISQSKEYGEQLAEGSEIELKVSNGPAPFELQNLYLMKKDDVDKLYRAKGLLIQYAEKETTEFAEGRILEQDIPAGSMVRKFDTLNLVVAKSVWSEWSTEKPTAKDNKKIETKTQYSYSDYVEEHQLDNDTKTGWTLLSDRTESVYNDDYGAWSEWSAESVNSSATRKTESGTEYRYRNKEQTTSDENSIAGWAKTGSTKAYSDYGTWSEWSTTMANESDTRKVEIGTEYRYRDKEFTTGDTASLAGWTSKGYTKNYTEYGSFSEWSATQADESETRKVETRTEYRSRTKQYKDSTDNPLDGWTQTGSRQDYTDYGHWSAWTGNQAVDSDTRKVETRTEYRTSQKKYTESLDSSLSGWTQTGSRSAYTDYGEWSDWQVEAVSPSDLCEVETRTTYLYFYWQCPNCGGHTGWFHSASNVSGKCAAYGGNCNYGLIYNDSLVQFYSTAGISGSITNGWTGESRNYAFTENGIAYTNGQSRTEYRYRLRTENVYYSYEKWDDWSNWTATPATASSTLQVETRTAYRYSDRSIITTYSYEKWGAWSDWSVTEMQSSATQQVETRTAYRYADRSIVYAYSFERWGNWSDWSSDSVSATESREIETRKIYRYADRTFTYTNSFERWGEWSDWSTSFAASTQSNEVETRTIYRYADKIPHTRYTFYMWTQPTEYSDSVAKESTTRKVTTRELYRYKTVE